MGRAEDLAAGAGVHQVPQGQEGSADRPGRLRLSSTRCKGWGGFGFYFLGSRATAYAKHPGRQGLAVRPRHDEAARQQPGLGARDPGRAGSMRCRREPADQINADPGTTAFQQFLAGTGSMLSWWGDVGSNVKTNDTSVVGDVVGFSILPGSDDVYNCQDRRMGQARQRPELRAEHGLYRLGRLRHGRVSTATRRSRRRPGRAAAHLGGKDLSLWMAAYPSGFQPYRNSHFNYRGMGGGGLRRGLHRGLSRTRNADSYNHPNAAIEPRIPGIFQYYSVAEDELAKSYRRPVQVGAGNGPTRSPPPGRRSPTRSAATTRSSSTRPRSACKLPLTCTGWRRQPPPVSFCDGRREASD